jgi:alpha-mannosidase
LKNDKHNSKKVRRPGRTQSFREPNMLFLTSYAHLDTQWRWDYVTTIQKYLKSTLEDNFRLFEKYPTYQFNFTGALRYMMIKEYYPEQFEQLKMYIKQNRWHIAGTSLDETDAIVPSSESMIRNILYGSRYFLQEFGKTSKDYMLPDCFGFPGNMPTILSHCGIKGFSTQKLTWRSINGIPFAIGVWEGPDGAELTAALSPGTYTSKIKLPLYTITKWLLRIKKHRKSFGVPKDYRYYGTGDIGGSPDEKSIKRVEKLLQKTQPFIRQESSDRFFTTLTKSEKIKLPRFSGDLLLTRHSAGSITSQSIMKRWNRMNEQLAFAAESAAVSATWLNGVPYPSKKIESAWYRVIGSQMHDIIPGTATPKAYTYAYNDEVVALNSFSSVLEDAAESIAGRMPLQQGKNHLLLFNPAGSASTTLVNAEIGQVKFSSRLRIEDSEGTLLPLQVLDQKEDRASVLIAAPMNPAAWKLLTVVEDQSQAKPIVPFPATVKKIETGFQLENRLYRIKISKDGSISSIFLKEMDGVPGKEFLEAPMHYSMQKEKPFLFPAWNMDWKDRRKKPHIVSQASARILITEQGPLRATIRVEFIFGKSSRVIKHISLNSIGNEELINIDDRISWYERGQSLKAVFPLTIHNEKTTYNWETARTTRVINSPSQYEFPSRYWIDHTDNQHNYGISILSPDKFGSDKPEDNLPRLTLLFTPGRSLLTFTFRDQMTQDWGRHHISYSLYPHSGDWVQADTEKTSHIAINPVRIFHPELRQGTLRPKKLLPANISLYSLSTSQVSVISCKMSESDQKSIIIRVKENWGQKLNKAELRFNSRILDAVEVDGLEQKIGEADWSGQIVKFDLNQNGIKTLAVRIAAGAGQKTATTIDSIYMDFPKNAMLHSENGDASAGSGPLFPLEIVPEFINNGPIRFQFIKSDQYCALACGGELLTIPDLRPGIRADSIYILAASDTGTDAVFRFPEAPDKEIVITVPPMTGFIGQYDTRIWERPGKEPRDYIWKNKCLRVDPGYITRQRLEFYSTHMHGAGIDFPYYYGYLYRFRIDLPPEVGSIQMPRDARIKIFAMTASGDNIMLKKSSILSDPSDFS